MQQAKRGRHSHLLSVETFIVTGISIHATTQSPIRTRQQPQPQLQPRNQTHKYKRQATRTKKEIRPKGLEPKSPKGRTRRDICKGTCVCMLQGFSSVSSSPHTVCHAPRWGPPERQKTRTLPADYMTVFVHYVTNYCYHTVNRILWWNVTNTNKKRRRDARAMRKRRHKATRNKKGKR